jgi:hypothetical protein
MEQITFGLKLDDQKEGYSKSFSDMAFSSFSSFPNCFHLSFNSFPNENPSPQMVWKGANEF